ncbi:MAG: HNH nuclease family protein [Burkholderiales bacterium]|nr:HNH nuclease family protein [Burkholderiales bacterium]
MVSRKPGSDSARLDRVVAEARRAAEERARGYRELALKMYPWICGRCAREFTRANVHLLEVHHRDHDHANNPPDGSNWELLCTYCHENEHQRRLDATGTGPGSAHERTPQATFRPFEGLDALLKKK